MLKMKARAIWNDKGKDTGKGSVKKFVSLVKNGSFLVRIKI